MCGKTFGPAKSELKAESESGDLDHCHASRGSQRHAALDSAAPPPTTSLSPLEEPHRPRTQAKICFHGTAKSWSLVASLVLTLLNWTGSMISAAVIRSSAGMSPT